jgi:hypothetical protein
VEVFDNDDGTYTVQYLPTYSAELYTISVTTNSDSANVKTSQLKVFPNITKPNNCLVTSSDFTWPALGAITNLEIGTLYTFTTTLRDTSSNIVDNVSHMMVTILDGQGS